MFTRILNDAAQRVRVAAGEVRHTVAQQAATARELLGIGTVETAWQLEAQLEYQATNLPQTSQAVGDLFRKWASSIVASHRDGCERFPDVPRTESDVFVPAGRHSHGSDSSKLPHGESSNKQKEPPSPTGSGTPPPPSSTSEPGPTTGHAEPPPAPAAFSNDIDESHQHTAKPDDLTKLPSDENKGGTSPASDATPSSTTTTSSTATNNTRPPPARQSTSPTVRRSETNTSTVGGDTWGAITYKQVFLRSHALEHALISLARRPDIRDSFMGPLDENESGTPRAHIYQLLSVTLRGEQKLIRELLYLILTSDLSSQEYFGWLSHMVTSLKIEWGEEKLMDERRRLSQRIEYQKVSVYNAAPTAVAAMSASKDGGSSSSKDGVDGWEPPFKDHHVMKNVEKHSSRVAHSKELIDYYILKQKNLGSSAAHSSKLLTDKRSDLEALKLKLHVSKREYADSAKVSSTSQVEIHEQMEEMGKKYAETLNALNTKALGYDTEIEKLDARANILMDELSKVRSDIAELQAAKKLVVNKANGVSCELEESQRKYKGKLTTEDELKHDREQRRQDASNLEALASQGEEQLIVLLTEDRRDLQHKLSSMRRPLVEAIRNHFTYEESRLQFHGEILAAYIASFNSLEVEKERLEAAAKKLNMSIGAKERRDSAELKEKDGGTGPGLSRMDEDEREAKEVNEKNRWGIESQLLEIRKREIEVRHQFARTVGQLDIVWRDIVLFRKGYDAVVRETMKGYNTEEKPKVEGGQAEGNEGVNGESVTEGEKLVEQWNNQLNEMYISITKNISPYLELINS